MDTKQRMMKYLERQYSNLSQASQEAKLEEMKRKLEEPATHYPKLENCNYSVTSWGYTRYNAVAINKRHRAGNMFKDEASAKRSNLYKLLNSEYDYWFPGFSEKPDFEPKGLEWLDSDYRCWSLSVARVNVWEGRIYRWKRSEN